MSLPDSSPVDHAPPSDRKPILCYVTDRLTLQVAPRRDLIAPLLDKIELLAAAGVDWIQLREKDLSGKPYATLTSGAFERVSKQASHGRPWPRLFVNDRLDVAIAEQAGGVHLGENSLPVEEAHRMGRASHAARPGDFLVGVSTHSFEAAQSAASGGADHIFFGPVFATPSKSAYGAPQGLKRLAEVCASVSIPVLAIGGITLQNAHACFSAGAAGIAAVRLFQDSGDPATIVRALRHRNF